MSDASLQDPPLSDERFAQPDARNPHFEWPPPPGCERQWFEVRPGRWARHHKRERELAVEKLREAAAVRDFATMKALILWLWRECELSAAMSREWRADLPKQRREFQRKLKAARRERLELLEAKGIEVKAREVYCARIEQMIGAFEAAVEGLRAAMRKSPGGRPGRGKDFEDLIGVWTLMLAAKTQAEKPASYREISDSLNLWGFEAVPPAHAIKEIARRVTKALSADYGRTAYPISASVADLWQKDLKRQGPWPPSASSARRALS